MSAPDAMIVVNQRDEIVLVNKRAERQFGYSAEELCGLSLKTIIRQGFTTTPNAKGAAAADPIAEQPHDRPEQRSPQQRNRGEQPLLCRRQMQRVAQERRERSQQDPDHEADVEVQQRRDEGRQVPGCEKPATAHAGSPSRMMPSSTRVG